METQFLFSDKFVEMADRIRAICEEKKHIEKQAQEHYNRIRELDVEAKEVYKEFQEWCREASLNCGDG